MNDMLRLTAYPEGREKMVYPHLTQDECTELREMFYYDGVDMVITADTSPAPPRLRVVR